MSTLLPESFFKRDTRTVARELLGMRLVRVLNDGKRLSGIIIETEAYLPGDSCSHAYRGKTQRNAAMFLPAAMAYVYFTYGMHYCFNIVTEPAGIPAAVLIRALQPDEGTDIMRIFRAGNVRDTGTPVNVKLVDLCRGPARLCQSLAIDNSFNAYELQRPASLLFIEQCRRLNEHVVRVSPRVRVHGTASDALAMWRWYVSDNSFVSKEYSKRATQNQQ